MNEKKEEVKINGKFFPKNLELLRKKENFSTDYEIREVFFLELKHGLMGFFPAKINETGEIVLVLDQDLLKGVLEKLPKRDFKQGMTLFYIHKKDFVGYSANLYCGDEFSLPHKVVTEEEFEVLMNLKENPFRWARGLVG